MTNRFSVFARGTACLATMTALVVGLVVVPGVAQAATARNATRPNTVQVIPNATKADCATGQVCWYTSEDLTGTLLSVPATAHGCTAVPSAFNDQMSSWFNNSSARAKYWVNFPCGGAHQKMAPHALEERIPPRLNDKMSAYAIS